MIFAKLSSFRFRGSTSVLENSGSIVARLVGWRVGVPFRGTHVDLKGPEQRKVTAGIKKRSKMAPKG
jgi:hypothetical protein